LKIAIITDTHFGARNDNVNFNDYFYNFYEGQFFPYLQQNNIKNVIHLGDVMDRRKFISYRIAKDFRERFILPFQVLDINLHMLVGNHDIFFKNTNDVNSLQELVDGRFKKIHLYAEAQEVNFDGLPILFMPWINSQNYIYALGMIDETKAQICMGHLDINGFAMNKGQILAEHGMNKSEFQKFDTVMSGHFHHKNDDGQIYYLGTPYEIYWNDYDDPKGFHIFDTETRELERIVNPLTIFDKIYYDDTKTDYSTIDVEKYKNKYIKLIVVNKKDLYGFDAFVDKLLKIDTYEVKIIEDFTDLDANSVSDDIVNNSEDTLTILNKYVDELDVSLDKNRLKNTMKSLYTEAQDLEI
jgi:DNA repair exonuclease SbcCD nuclease subunit